MAEETTNDEESRSSMSKSFRIGRLKGTVFYLHWTYLAVLGFNLLLALLSNSDMGRVILYTFTLFGPMVLLSLLVHEMGHIIATKKLGGEVEEVILWPLGGLSFYGPSNLGYMGDLKVAVAGPLMQIPLIIVLLTLYETLRDDDMSAIGSIYPVIGDITGDISRIFIAVCMATFWFNVITFLLNVFIPIYPLDGVRLYAAGLKALGASLTKAAKIISYYGMFISICTFVLGAMQMFFSTVYGGGLFEMALGAFGFVNSKDLYDKIKAGRLREDKILGRSCYEQETEGIEINNSVEEQRSSNTPAPVPLDTTEVSEIL